VDERRFRDAEAAVWSTLRLAPSERVVDGVRVQEVGDPQGPPVVLVHGTTTSGFSWGDLVARLPQRRCILIDRPGCGLSAPAPHDHGALVPRVLDGLGLERADVVSTSYGSHFALHTAIAHAERLRHLVLIAWSVGAPTARLPLMMRMGNNRRVGAVMARMPANRAMVRSMLRQISVNNTPPHVVDGMLATLRFTDTMRNEVALAPNVQQVRFTAGELARITTPTHLVWGSDDAFGGVDEARAFAGMIPAATLTMLDGAGHAPWLDHPERVAAEVSAFLS
jgi:pimeloyl-ACP methyl ester carboxylesterase